MTLDQHSVVCCCTLRMRKEGRTRVSNLLSQAEEAIAEKSDLSNSLDLVGLRGYFEESLLSGRTTFVIGAGMSIPYGMPAWSALCSDLIEHILSNQGRAVSNLNTKYFRHISPLLLVRYIKSSLRFPEAITDFVHESIYRDYCWPIAPTATRLLAQICGSAASSGRPMNVINFNYDSVFEEEVSKLFPKLPFDVAFDNTSFSSARHALRVFHVHGYLPHQLFSQLRSNQITLSEEDYHAHYADPLAWQNIALLNCLTQTNCLFLGLSFTDPNLRRMIDVLSRRRPSLRHVFFSRPIKQGENVFPNSEENLSEAQCAIINDFYRQIFADMRVSLFEVEEYSQIIDALSQLQTQAKF